MKGIYICAGQNITDKSSGIGKKINSQISEFEKNEIEIELKNISNKMNFKDRCKFMIPCIMSNYEERMVNAINKIEYCDFVYIRKITFCSGFINMLKIIKRKFPNVLVIMEVPTYPLRGEYAGLKKILNIFSALYEKKLKSYIDYIVTYSNDSYIWGIKCINISNSVDFSKIKIKEKSSVESINMIGVALFSKWHGYDRLIKGIYEYYKNGGQRIIHLYLVGGGSYYKKYKKLINDFSIGDHVHLIGPKYGEELDSIYNQCNIGIDSLARHRSKVYYNSSLKGKEYAAKGLPIVSGVKTELDFFESYKYYMRVPSDESPIKMDEIVTFFDNIYRNEKQDAIIKQIVEYNKKYFNFTTAFEPVIRTVKKE